jgi:two-component system, LytTR family, sensor kinase
MSAPAVPETRFLRDFWPRVLLSPVFGVVIPLTTGLIDPARHTSAGMALSFLYFSVTAWLVWEGNRRIYLRLPHRQDWLDRPWRRILTLLGAVVLYTIPASTLLLVMWRLYTKDPGMRPHALPTAVLAIVTAVVVVTHVYETVFLLHDWESDRLRNARLDRARTEAEFETLRREVDPHFLFNNLNALVHLIEIGHPSALPFIDALSATYRYVLEARHRPLVTLAEELEALRRHLVLANIRYGDVLRLRIAIDEQDATRLLLPPVCLGELLLNSVKHNAATAERPLDIDVRLNETTLEMSNEHRPLPHRTASTNLGLENLAQRHRFATGLQPTWGIENGRFFVRLPLAAGPPVGEGDRHETGRHA